MFSVQCPGGWSFAAWRRRITVYYCGLSDYANTLSLIFKTHIKASAEYHELLVVVVLICKVSSTKIISEKKIIPAFRSRTTKC